MSLVCRVHRFLLADSRMQVLHQTGVSPRDRLIPGSTTHIDPDQPVAVGEGPGVSTADVYVDIGDAGAAGELTVRNDNDDPVFLINGATAAATIGSRRVAGTVLVRSDSNGPLIELRGKTGSIAFRDASLAETIIINGMKGDIELLGADCAEHFEVGAVTPGEVLCANDSGVLQPCSAAYDTRVVGVVSGAGGFAPGMTLNSSHHYPEAAALALVGRVYCRVDADVAPIRVGDLLTTSDTRGHAMRASDPSRAFGSVLGKSLAELSSGRGLVPVLVSLQ